MKHLLVLSLAWLALGAPCAAQQSTRPPLAQTQGLETFRRMPGGWCGSAGRLQGRRSALAGSQKCAASPCRTRRKSARQAAEELAAVTLDPRVPHRHRSALAAADCATAQARMAAQQAAQASGQASSAWTRALERLEAAFRAAPWREQGGCQERRRRRLRGAEGGAQCVAYRSDGQPRRRGTSMESKEAGAERRYRCGRTLTRITKEKPCASNSSAARTRLPARNTCWSTTGAGCCVDCGLFQGLKQLRLRNWERLADRGLAEIDAVLLTHAHMDHSGFVPRLVKLGFKGPVYCTEATRELCELLLPDSGRLQEEEADFANRHGHSKHKPALPLYTEEDARARAEALRGRSASTRSIRPGPAGRGALKRAGHILGAASAHIAWTGGSILFSGDLGRSDDLVMRPPEAPEPADYVVVESTYGDRLHRDVDTLAALARWSTAPRRAAAWSSSPPSPSGARRRCCIASTCSSRRIAFPTCRST